MKYWFLPLLALVAFTTPDLAEGKSRRKGKRKRATASKLKTVNIKNQSQIKCLSGGTEKRCYHGGSNSDPDPVADHIIDWSDAQRARKAGDKLKREQAEEEESLADAIARSFSWPTPGPIELEPGMSLRTTFEYTRNRVKSRLLDVVNERLRRLRGRSIAVCFAGPPTAKGHTDIIRRMKLAKGADKTLLTLLAVPEDQIKPYNLLRLKVQGRVYTLDKGDVGSDLFMALKEKLDDGKTVYLSMNPRPRRVQLKVTIPATVDGAAQEFVLTKRPANPKQKGIKAADVEIKTNAQWVVRPGNQTIKVDQGLLGHKLLIHQMMGKNKKEERQTLIIKPSDWLTRTPTYRRDLGVVAGYALHAHGGEDLWFGKSAFNVTAEMYVHLGVSNCDVLVEILPVFPTITLGPLSLAEWGQVSGLTVIDPETHNVRIGYMDPPYCGGIIK
jgi:hypothetical protein